MERQTQRELPHLVRIDAMTHACLKELKRRQKKSMAQIIIDLVEKEYLQFTETYGEQQKQTKEKNKKVS